MLRMNFLMHLVTTDSSEMVLSTVTINWCDWNEVGMAVRAIDNFSEVYGAKRETTTAVSPSEGVDIFLRIIGSEHR